MKPRDWMTESGAAALAHRIERYWEDRGYVVHTHLTHQRDDFFVRSDMINGLPPKGPSNDQA